MISGEVYFLNQWYADAIDDFTIYEKFAEKWIAGQSNRSFNLEQASKQIAQFHFTIPTNVLHDIFTRLNEKYPGSFDLTNGVFTVRNVPREIVTYFAGWEKEFERNTQAVFRKFNAFLTRSNREEVNFSRFQHLLGEIEDSFLYEEKIQLKKEMSEDARILTDFISFVFHSDHLTNLREHLTRILHSVIV